MTERASPGAPAAGPAAPGTDGRSRGWRRACATPVATPGGRAGRSDGSGPSARAQRLAQRQRYVAHERLRAERASWQRARAAAARSGRACRSPPRACPAVRRVGAAASRSSRTGASAWRPRNTIESQSMKLTGGPERRKVTSRLFGCDVADDDGRARAGTPSTSATRSAARSRRGPYPTRASSPRAPSRCRRRGGARAPGAPVPAAGRHRERRREPSAQVAMRDPAGPRPG